MTSPFPRLRVVILLASASVAWLSPRAIAQETVRLNLNGRVEKATQLDFAPVADLTITREGATNVRIHLSNPPTAENRAVVLPLLLRSNCEAVLIAGSAALEGEDEITLRIETIRADGPLVRDEALQALRSLPAAYTLSAHEPQVQVSLPRISGGGTRNSRSNVLVIEALVRSRTANSVDLVLSLLPRDTLSKLR